MFNLYIFKNHLILLVKALKDLIDHSFQYGKKKQKKKHFKNNFIYIFKYKDVTEIHVNYMITHI